MNELKNDKKDVIDFGAKAIKDAQVLLDREDITEDVKVTITNLLGVMNVLSRGYAAVLNREFKLLNNREVSKDGQNKPRLLQESIY